MEIHKKLKVHFYRHIIMSLIKFQKKFTILTLLMSSQFYFFPIQTQFHIVMKTIIRSDNSLEFCMPSFLCIKRFYSSKILYLNTLTKLDGWEEESTHSQHSMNILDGLIPSSSFFLVFLCLSYFNKILVLVSVNECWFISCNDVDSTHTVNGLFCWVICKYLD